MNKMSEVAKLLDLELEEEFTIEGRTLNYKFTNQGIEEFETGSIHSYLLHYLLLGELKIKKLPWRPKQEETYYCPAFNFDMYCAIWFDINHDFDKFNLENNLCFRTNEEAIECTKRMLEVLKNE